MNIRAWLACWLHYRGHSWYRADNGDWYCIDCFVKRRGAKWQLVPALEAILKKDYTEDIPDDKGTTTPQWIHGYYYGVLTVQEDLAKALNPDEEV